MECLGKSSRMFICAIDVNGNTYKSRIEFFFSGMSKNSNLKWIFYNVIHYSWLFFFFFWWIRMSKPFCNRSEVLKYYRLKALACLFIFKILGIMLEFSNLDFSSASRVQKKRGSCLQVRKNSIEFIHPFGL